MRVRDLIDKARETDLLRQDPVKEMEYGTSELVFELKRSPFSGTEFGYDPVRDRITWAWRTIDGTQIETGGSSINSFLAELCDAVGEQVEDYLPDEQPCWYYDARRA